MTEKQQPQPEAMTQQPQYEDSEQRPAVQPLAERPHDDQALQTARRRASLKNEIRAGWQRALGH